MVFCGRSLALMLVTYYEEEYHQAPNYYFNFAIVMLTLFAADVSSWSVGDNRTGSVRDLPAHPAVRVFYSLMQFGGTAYSLFGLRRQGAFFYFVFIMQVNSLLMTLRRKNLVSKPFNMVVYGLMLLGGFVVGEYELRTYLQDMPTYNGVAFRDTIWLVAALLRLGPRLPALRIAQDNKYLLWLSVGLWAQKFRPLYQEEELRRELVILHYVVWALAVTMFVWKGFLADKLRVAVKKKTV